ncbi:unnamed protein product [Brachionus calyciflorus]|uniref:Uncharacterized protein n=1 Tax=Brachionus calyciflorus TaxID=104777 RepID=A0A813ZQ57_9BILA|nr:unnamed protein product [Brachionus calyciflorus]
MTDQSGGSVKWNFKNSLKLNLKGLDRPLVHRELLGYLTIAFSDEARANILTVGNFSSNRIWIIEFSSRIDATMFYGKQIIIEGRTFSFYDPNNRMIDEGKKSAVLRFHFLPPNITDQTISRFIGNLKLKDLQIREISNETINVVGWTKVTNGIKRVKISYPVDIDDQIQNMVGPTTVFGLKTNITIAGQKQRCFFCLDPNHTIKHCPLKSIECSKFNLKGHPAIKCSMAEKIKSMERNKTDFSDLFVNDEIPPLSLQEDEQSNEILIPVTSAAQVEASNEDGFFETNRAIQNLLQNLATSSFSPQTDEDMGRLASNENQPQASTLSQVASNMQVNSHVQPFSATPIPKILEQPFQTPAVPEIPSLTPVNPLPRRLTTPSPRPGRPKLNTPIAPAALYDLSSANESDIPTQQLQKQKKKRTANALSGAKKKNLKSTSSIDESAFFDTADELKNQ